MSRRSKGEFILILLCLLGAFHRVAAQNITSGLIARYTFEGSASDQSGNANHASPAGSFQYVSAGLQGSALRITGDRSLFYAGGGHVILPNFGTYMNSGFSVSLWVKDEVMGGYPVGEETYFCFGVGDLPVVGINFNSDTRTVMSFINAGAGGVARDFSRSLSSTSDLATWRHLVVTYSPGRTATYFNGAKIGEAAITVNVFPVSRAALGRHWWSGGSASSARMSVTYDNVRIYNRALSDSDVQLLYASESPPAPPPQPPPPPPPPVAPLVTQQASTRTLVEGDSTVFSVIVTGTAPFSYQWRKDGVIIMNATNAALTLSPVRMEDTGAYSLLVSNSAGSATSASSFLIVRPGNPGRLSNLSIRTATGAASETLIVGFVLGSEGTGAASLLVRGAGPSLAQFGVTGTLPDPVLTLYDGGRLLASNNDWSGSNDVFATVGAFPFLGGSKDAALVSPLVSSAYTVQLFDANNGSGTALVEVYDTEPGFAYTRARLKNVSARASVGTGGNLMIAGFSVKGTTPLNVLIRGIGPSLAQFGVSGVLADPRMTLYRDGTLVTTNDNWGDIGASTIAASAGAVGAFPLAAASRDSAILATLQAGSYTVQLVGVGETTGVGLVEIYEAP